ncbi:hypothetical protein VP1G_05730 [Cytospora mali]|uniref:Uncharacterized protein n=1 Tax=Cytospora mali TaxID=578113 RepID=A0A194V384_CYTMA|nr:hypothetical protein VP1G_05730 [Valsa mali var. pyri (nom. inval.)]
MYAAVRHKDRRASRRRHAQTQATTIKHDKSRLQRNIAEDRQADVRVGLEATIARGVGLVDGRPVDVITRDGDLAVSHGEGEVGKGLVAREDYAVTTSSGSMRSVVPVSAMPVMVVDVRATERFSVLLVEEVEGARAGLACWRVGGAERASEMTVPLRVSFLNQSNQLERESSDESSLESEVSPNPPKPSPELPELESPPPKTSGKPPKPDPDPELEPELPAVVVVVVADPDPDEVPVELALPVEVEAVLEVVLEDVLEDVEPLPTAYPVDWNVQYPEYEALTLYRSA